VAGNEKRQSYEWMCDSFVFFLCGFVCAFGLQALSFCVCGCLCVFFLLLEDLLSRQTVYVLTQLTVELLLTVQNVKKRTNELGKRKCVTCHRFLCSKRVDVLALCVRSGT